MKNSIVYSLLVSIGLLLINPLFAQSKKDAKRKLGVQATLKRVIDSYYSLNWFKGIVLISNKSDVFYRNATGYANWDYNVPNSLSTSYNIGMTTQVFTATAIMQLVAKGDIKIKGFLKDYMPKVAEQLDYPITIHQLLNHTSGLANYYESGNYLSNFLKLNKIEDLIAVIVAQPMQHMPGYDLYPSPSNYVLLAGLIEKVSGISYPEYIKQNILEPSNMSNAKLSTWNQRIINKATAYVGTAEHEPIVAANIWGAYPFGSEGLYCNVEDLWKFTQAFFNGELLPEKYQNMMLRNYEYIDSHQKNDHSMKIHANGYSYGWRTKQYRNYKVIYHNSFLPGTNIEARTYDNFEERYTIILLSNLSTDQTFALANELDKVICEPKYKAPSSRIAMLIQNTIDYQGMDFLKANFDSLLRSNQLEMNRSWQINTLAWNYKEKDELQIAQDLFELNATYFPRDLLIQEGLGEIYLAQKNYDKAKQCFEQCLHFSINHGKRQSIEKTIKNIEAKKAKAKAEGQYPQQPLTSNTQTPPKQKTSKVKTTEVPMLNNKRTVVAAKNNLSPQTITTQTTTTALPTDVNLKTPTTNKIKQKKKKPTSPTTGTKSRDNITTTTETSKPVSTTQNIPPHFPGGKKALEQYLINNLKLSPEAFATADKETVYVGFIVRKNGKLRNIKATKGLTKIPSHYRKEAVRLVKNMPPWVPARHNEKRIATYHLLPIEFEKLFENVK